MRHLARLAVPLLLAACGGGVPACCHAPAPSSADIRDRYRFRDAAISDDGAFLVATDGRCRGHSWALVDGVYVPRAQRAVDPTGRTPYRCSDGVEIRVHGGRVVERHVDVPGRGAPDHESQNVYVWDVNTGEMLQEWRGQRSWAGRPDDAPFLWLSPDMSTLVLETHEGRSRSRHFATVDLLGDAEPVPLTWPLLNPRIRRWAEQLGEDPPRGESLPQGDEPPVFSSNGRRLWLGGCVFDAKKGEEVFCRPWGADEVYSGTHRPLMLTDDGRAVLVRSGFARWHVDRYALETGQELWTYRPDEYAPRREDIGPSTWLTYGGGPYFVVSYCGGGEHEIRRASDGTLAFTAPAFYWQCSRGRLEVTDDGGLVAGVDTGTRNASMYVLYDADGLRWGVAPPRGWPVDPWIAQVNTAAGRMVLRAPLTVLDLETGRQVAPVVAR